MGTEWIILGGAALGALWLKSAYGALVTLDERCRAAQSDIDALIKHRHDLIPGLVETVKAYAGHERGILIEVTRAHAAAVTGAGTEAKAEAKLSATVQQLITSAQRWPDLKASASFEGFRRDLIETEQKIANARRFHHLTVAEYNAARRGFPGTLFARLARLERHDGMDLGLDRVLMDEPAPVRF